MMPQCDYYAILNVSRDASEDEIKRVYRQLALKYHPDKNPNDKIAVAKFREATEAYEILCNVTERTRYDQNNPPEPGHNVEYNLKVSHENVTYVRQITLEEVTFEVAGSKIKMRLNNNNNGTYRLRGQGKRGAHGGVRGDLLVNINVHKSDASPTFWAKDGSEMVLIPAGEFLMGSHRTLDNIDKPQHTVYLDAFYMDKYEVTVGQYRQFLETTGHRNLPDWVPRYSPTDEHPVVGISWNDAMAYAQWAGKRLPTEAEWEKAARGGLEAQYGDLTYPWGYLYRGRFLPDADKANYDKNVGKTTPIGSYPPNGYGLYDMAGNVWEWCLDEYNPTFYANSPYRNPISGGVSVQEFINNITNVPFPAVFRGAAWSSSWSQLHVSYRYFNRSLDLSPDVGFRCAMSVIP